MALPLIKVEKTGAWRWVILVLCAIASGTLTGTVFGFVPLQNVMIAEGVCACVFVCCASEFCALAHHAPSPLGPHLLTHMCSPEQ